MFEECWGGRIYAAPRAALPHCDGGPLSYWLLASLVRGVGGVRGEETKYEESVMRRRRRRRRRRKRDNRGGGGSEEIATADAG